MRANFIIVLCVALFLESVVSFVDHEPSMKYSSHEARGLAAPDPSIKYPSSDQRSLSGPPTWKDDFDIETDLSPEDRALIEEAEENLTPSEQQMFCDDWKPDVAGVDQEEQAPDFLDDGSPSEEQAPAQVLSQEETARKLSIRERLADLDNRVQHVYGRRLCAWKARTSCPQCLMW